MKYFKFKSLFFLLILMIAASSYGQKMFNVRDFGAKGNGRTDDRKAIQKAIDAAGNYGNGTVFFPKGIYVIKSYIRTSNYLENYMVRLKSGIHIKGSGNSTILKLGCHLYDKKDTAANAHLFYGFKNERILFSDFIIDMNGTKNLVPKETIKNYSAIFTNHGSDYTIRNITILNTAGRTMVNIMGRGNGLIIENSRFLNGGPYPGNTIANPFQNDFSFIYSEWDNTKIMNNVIEQQDIDIALTSYTGGIEIHGNQSRAIGNFIKGCWPAVYITSSNRKVMEDVLIKDNEMKDCLTGVSFWLMDTMKNIEISNNNISLTFPRNNILHITAGIVIPNGNSLSYSDRLANNAPVYDLRVKNNIFTAEPMNNLSAGMILHSLQNSEIVDNKISGMNYAGVSILGSKWGMNTVSIARNRFSEFRTNGNKETVAGFFVVTDTYSTKNTSSPGFKAIVIDSNQFIGNNKQLNNGIGKFLGSFVALPKKVMEGVRFKSNNFFSDKTLSVHWVETR